MRLLLPVICLAAGLIIPTLCQQLPDCIRLAKQKGNIDCDGENLTELPNNVLLTQVQGSAKVSPPSSLLSAL